MKEPLTIYLAELAHNTFGLELNTVPLGIGCVGAYCQGQLSGKVSIRLFRTFDALSGAMAEKPAQIVGFGLFAWNNELTLTAADFLGRRYPKTLIVVGGANISFQGWFTSGSQRDKTPKLYARYARQKDWELLNVHPAVDFLVHGDGEIPFAGLIKAYLDCRDKEILKSRPVDGCTALWQGELVAGKASELLYDLDTIPSPYLTGLFDELLKHYLLVPQIETVRGCPYNCTYCTIGGNESKLRTHGPDYVKAEIRYLRDHSRTGVLRIADSNWGILDRDVDLARYINDMNTREGYPSGLRVYYAGRSSYPNVRTMAATLKKLLPLNMSFQSLTPEVLNEIKRRNMPRDRVIDMVRFAKEQDIAVSTELISGLPRETFNSFRRVFADVIELGFDSIYIGNLYLIRNSELDTPDARTTYGFRTMSALIGRNVSQIDGAVVFETDEVVVASDSMSHEDFWKVQAYNLFGFICYGAAFMKEMIRHGMNNGMDINPVYDEIRNDSERYPVFTKILDTYLNTVRSKYFNSKDTLACAITASMQEKGNVDDFSWYRQFFYYCGLALSSQYKSRLIAEYSLALESLSHRQGNAGISFFDALNTLTRFSNAVTISPLEPLTETLCFHSPYDIVAWSMNGYKPDLSQYRVDDDLVFDLSVRNYAAHKELIEQTAHIQDPVERYHLYFTTLVSANMRRCVRKRA